MQALFTIIFYFVEIALYNGYLLLGYTTCYTILPSISLILDEDIPLHAVLKFPPLYETLQKGRYLSTKSFMIWTLIALY